MQLDPGSGPYWADTPELQYDSNTADYVIRQVNMMRRKEEAPADGRARWVGGDSLGDGHRA